MVTKYVVNIYRSRGAGGIHARKPLEQRVVEAESPGAASNSVYASLQKLARPGRRFATETVGEVREDGTVYYYS
jgi:hypothetical protein